MTGLERELREILQKYEMDICEISILFSPIGRNILAISFEEIENDNRIRERINCK